MHLCIWICVFGCQTRGNIVFEVLVRFPFQKYITSWVFSGFLDVLDVLDVLDDLDVLDVLDLLDLAKVCSEKISLISTAKRCSYNSPTQRSNPDPSQTHPLIAPEHFCPDIW